MAYAKDTDQGGGNAPKPKPSGGYSIGTQYTLTAAPTNTPSGQYTSPAGGGAPRSAPASNQPGPVPRTGSNGGGGGGGQRQQKKAAKAPGVPDVNAYLAADSQFQSDRNNLIKNFRALEAKNKTGRGDLESNFKLTLERLGKEQAQSQKAMEADYAARGLFGSGVYQDSLNDFNLGYTNQQNDARTSYNQNLTQLLNDLNDAKRGQDADLNQIRLDAIRRRAEKYGIK